MTVIYMYIQLFLHMQLAESCINWYGKHVLVIQSLLLLYNLGLICSKFRRWKHVQNKQNYFGNIHAYPIYRQTFKTIKCYLCILCILIQCMCSKTFFLCGYFYCFAYWQGTTWKLFLILMNNSCSIPIGFFTLL